MRILVHHVKLTFAQLIRLALARIVLLSALARATMRLIVVNLATTRKVVLLGVRDVLSTLRRRRMVECTEAGTSSSLSLAMTLSVCSGHGHTRVVSDTILARIDGRDGVVSRAF